MPYWKSFVLVWYINLLRKIQVSDSEISQIKCVVQQVVSLQYNK